MNGKEEKDGKPQTGPPENNTFSYSGYQVVHNEFFAHQHEPCFVLSDNKIHVNAACLRKFPITDYVQLLVNPVERKLAIRPCNEGERDSLRWCTNPPRRLPRHIPCRIFFAKMVSLMDWDPDCRYSILGKLVESGGQSLLIFDLCSAEVYSRPGMGSSREGPHTPIHPAGWQDQFGMDYEEHHKSIQIGIFDEYTVFGVQDNKTEPPDGQEVPYAMEGSAGGATSQQEAITVTSDESKHP